VCYLIDSAELMRLPDRLEVILMLRLLSDPLPPGNALEIRDKSIRFQHEMHKRRRLSHELATD